MNHPSRKILVALEAIMSLEAIASYLRKESAQKGLNKSSLKMANVAIESICTQANVKTNSLAFSLEGFENDVEVTVTQGLDNISQKTTVIWSEIDAAMKSTLSNLCESMTGFQSKLRALESKINDTEALVRSKESMKAPEGEDVLLTPSDWDGLYDHMQQIPQFGEGICTRVDRLMDEHSAGFKTAVAEQVNWLKQAAPKLSANHNPFTANPPDLSALLILDCSRDRETDDEVTKDYLSSELPGLKMLTMSLPPTAPDFTASGDYLSSVDCAIVEYIGMRAKSIRIAVMWSSVSALRRIEELKASVAVLQRWYQAIYVDIWKDQAYEIMLNQALCKDECANHGSRELKLYVLSLLHLMTVATKDVDTYAFDTYNCVLDYICASMAKYS